MLFSLKDLHLRRLSKQANQRLVRLEKWQKEHGEGYTPAYEQAMFYLQDKTGKKRFSESLSKLSDEEKREQLFKVTAFLNNPLSQVKALNQREKLRKKVQVEMDNVQKEQQKAGLFGKLDLQRSEDAMDEKRFWQLFDTAKSIGLTKAFDYKTIANLMSWKLETRQPRVFRKIAEWLLTLDDFEKMNRDELFRKIGEL